MYLKVCMALRRGVKEPKEGPKEINYKDSNLSMMYDNYFKWFIRISIYSFALELHSNCTLNRLDRESRIAFTGIKMVVNVESDQLEL